MHSCRTRAVIVFKVGQVLPLASGVATPMISKIPLHVNSSQCELRWHRNCIVLLRGIYKFTMDALHQARVCRRSEWIVGYRKMERMRRRHGEARGVRDPPRRPLEGADTLDDYVGR